MIEPLKRKPNRFYALVLNGLEIEAGKRKAGHLYLIGKSDRGDGKHHIKSFSSDGSVFTEKSARYFIEATTLREYELRVMEQLPDYDYVWEI